MSTEPDGNANVRLGWLTAAKVLAAPGLVAGIGGMLVWIMVVSERMGLQTLPPLLKPFLFPVIVAGAFAAGHGAFFAPLFVIPALLIAIIRSFVHRPAPRVLCATWSWVLLGLAGIVLAWTCVPRLL